MRIARPKFKLIALVTLTLGVVAAIAAIASGGSGGGEPSPAHVHARHVEHAGGHDHADHAGDPAHARVAFVRTLSLYTEREPAPSASRTSMRALLVNGAAPRQTVTATVLTDEDCAPDARAVSHCRNKLRLGDGRTLVVRHPHRMSDVPCMVPGEKVRVRPAVDA